MGQPPDDVEIVGEPFMDNPLVVIAAPDHRLVGSEHITIEDMKAEPYVVREPGSGTRGAMVRLFAQHDINPVIAVEIADNAALKRAVASGLGLGVVSRNTLDMDLKTGSLVTLSAEHFPIMRQWFLVSRKGKRLSPIALAFKAFVFEHALELVQS